jgi:membrane protein
MSWKDVWGMLKETVEEWFGDKAQRMGAALAYYGVFSLGPLLLIALAVAGMVFGKEAAQGEIVAQIGSTVGPTAAEAVQKILNQQYERGGGAWATVIGVVFLMVTATTFFAELQDAMNTVWKVKPKEGLGIWDTIRIRLLSLAVVLGTAFLLLVSLIVNAALAATGKYFHSAAASIPGGPWLWWAVNAVLSLALITVLFALIFKLLPDAKVAWGDVWLGAGLTALLFSVGKYLIGLYLGQSSVTSSFGAAGSVVVILIWVYYSTQLLILGAEFTRVYARRRGSVPEPLEHAEAVCDEERVRQGLAPQGEGKPEYSRS